MIFIKIIFKILRIMHIDHFFQQKKSSFLLHEKNNYIKDIKSKNLYLIKSKHNIILSDFKKRYVGYLKKFTNNKQKENLIDLGAGQLIHSNYFLNYFNKIYAIEPSSNATNLGKKIYKINPKKINIINSFIENEIEKNYFKSAEKFFTGHVLSHLNQTSFLLICKFLNKDIKKGSSFIFDELWTEKNEIKERFFYARGKKIWSKYLNKWQLKFLKNKVKVGDKIIYKGILGSKLY